MMYAYYGGADVVKDLKQLHEKGQKGTKGITFPESYRKVASVMQDDRTNLQSLQKWIDTIIIEQWVMVHLDHQNNSYYIRPAKGVYS